MAVIWGLDMKELQWGKFKSSYMFKNRDYHQRRTKFILYQMAMIFCVVSESLGTAVLSDYIDQQDFLKHKNNDAIEYNDDYVGMDSYNIFAGVFVAFIFGAAFFFDLFWPERKEIPSVRLAWKVCSVLASIFMLASVITKTIIVSTHSAYVTGVDESVATKLLEQSNGLPLRYNHNPRAIASLVFAWVGFVSVVASTILMWMTINHIAQYGPFSTHARERKYPNKSRSDEETGRTKAEDETPTGSRLPVQSDAQSEKILETKQQSQPQAPSGNI